MSNSWIFAVLMSSTVLLSGCQSFKPKAIVLPSGNNNNNSNSNNAKNQFQLEGKIGVRTPQQSGSAFFSWAQQDQQFAIELTGILGVGKTLIQGNPGQVTLNSAKTGEITATTAEELLYRATGWQAPIGYLIDWTQGRPATLTAQIKQDQALRTEQIIEDGWDVQLSYEGTARLPNKLIMTQALEQQQQNRITMLIQNR